MEFDPSMGVYVMTTLRLDFHIGRVEWVTCQVPERNARGGDVKAVGLAELEAWKLDGRRKQRGGDVEVGVAVTKSAMIAQHLRVHLSLPRKVAETSSHGCTKTLLIDNRIRQGAPLTLHTPQEESRLKTALNVTITRRRCLHRCQTS